MKGQDKKRLQIGFIGGGNMGEALIRAILQKKLVSPSQISLFDVDPQKMREMRKKHGIVPVDSSRTLFRSSKIILLAVKPQQMEEVLKEVSPTIQKNHLVLSIAAGLDTNFFKKRLPAETRLIRAMPNLCAAIGEGATALYATPEATPQDRKRAEEIFSTAGEALWVKQEVWLDTVTAVSGSGPAFVFFLINAMIEAGKREGLPWDLCKKLVLQTFIGATKMAQTAREPLPHLINRVASKGGTTEAGLKVLQTVRKTILNTIRSSKDRARELSHLFSK